jgi:hypothetical protein
VILPGAELNAEIEHQTARDTTTATQSHSAHAALIWLILLAQRRASKKRKTAADGEFGKYE